MTTRLPEWRKSTRSNGSAGNCVEVALPGVGAAIRDSKNPEVTHVTVQTRGWTSFLNAVKSGRLDC